MKFAAASITLVTILLVILNLYLGNWVSAIGCLVGGGLLYYVAARQSRKKRANRDSRT